MFLFESCISQKTKRPNLFHQQGAVLIVGLIMLLIMTLVGVAAVRGTNLQELMAGNARDKQIGFQAAETALRQAELIVDGVSAPNVGAAGVIDEDSKGTLSSYWRDAYAWKDANKSVEADDALKFIQAKPRYVVEKLEVAYVPGSDGRAVDVLGRQSVPEISVYRITGRGVGITENSIVYLQSIFRRQ
jgi:type IV pilus assembly protein PilX